MKTVNVQPRAKTVGACEASLQTALDPGDRGMPYRQRPASARVGRLRRISPGRLDVQSNASMGAVVVAAIPMGTACYQLSQ